ncbi:hypothetical protein BDQ17DRAFT_1243521 [Cyathus striatus]|nr:hypothetical protein BDQ17DRAFT_1243521 [Cyathus striatus]
MGKSRGKGKVKEEPIDVDVDIAAVVEDVDGNDVIVEEEEGPACSICLQTLEDRTVLPTCSHDFCFECILVWTEQSRRCPLCNQSIGEYLIHSIRSKYDYRKHYLTPLRGKSPPPHVFASTSNPIQGIRRRRRQERQWGRRERDIWEEQDRLERSIEKRRWVYRWGLYAKHVASNAYTKYRPYPTPAQFAASQELISRTTIFLRRELQVWEGLDVEFLTSFTLSILKSLDIRSEGAIKLIAEFLDLDDEFGERKNAQHFSHEVYTYVRSPYRDLFVYDTVVQYDEPSGVPPPPDKPRSQRWRAQEQEPEQRPFTVGEYDRDQDRAAPSHNEEQAGTRVRSRSRSLQERGVEKQTKSQKMLKLEMEVEVRLRMCRGLLRGDGTLVLGT